MSPSSRSLNYLRDNGYMVDTCERWIPGARIRKDLFGFADLIAVKGVETIAIQTTSGANVSKRVNKIMGLREARAWLESGMRRIVVHGWAKRVVVVGVRKRDGRPIKRKRYQLRYVEITLDRISQGLTQAQPTQTVAV